VAAEVEAIRRLKRHSLSPRYDARHRAGTSREFDVLEPRVAIIGSPLGPQALGPRLCPIGNPLDLTRVVASYRQDKWPAKSSSRAS